MAIIQFENGVKVNFAGTPTPQDIEEVAAKLPMASSSVQNNVQQAQGPQLQDTGSFGGNLMNSAGNFVGGIGNALMHPIDTVTNLGKGLIGAGENAASYLTTGKSAAETVGPDQFNQVADSIGSFIKQRYGSIDAAKQTAYQDPIGFLADASVVLGGAGAALKGAGTASELGGLTRAGEMVSKAGSLADPINMASTGLGKLTRPISDFVGNQITNTLGATTGSGGSSVRELYNAGKAGDSTAINAARGNVSENQVIQNAIDAFDQIKTNRRVEYQTGLQGIKDTPGSLDWSPAVSEFKTQLENNGIKVTKDGLNFENARGFQNPSEQAVLQNAYDKVTNWGKIKGNQTVYGLDTLKQQLGDYIDMANGKAVPVLNQVKTALTDILKQNEDYKGLLSKYETTSNLIDDLRANLSLTNKNPETVLKKLTSAFKQDNEFRQSFISELNKISDQDIMAQLAGLNMSSLANRGKLTTLFEVGAAFAHPHLLPAFVAASPRVVAEFMNALGMGAKEIDKGLAFLKQYKADKIVKKGAVVGQRVNQANQSEKKKIPKVKAPVFSPASNQTIQ